MFGSENEKVLSLVIDADPGADNKQFHLMKAPRALTVTAMYVTAAVAQGAGTACVFALHNYGTSGTALESGGTVVGAIGGTASASRLSAGVPKAGTITSGQAYIDVGEWLVLQYNEEGSGFQSGDRFAVEVHYRDGE